MKRPNRITVVHASFLLMSLAIAARAGYVQLWQADSWTERAKRQHTTSKSIPAPRGSILDAEGTVLVESRPLVTLAIAPREIRRAERDRLVRELANAGVPRETINRTRDTSRAWVVVPGKFLSADLAGLTSLRGVYTEPTFERVPSRLVGLRGILGHAAADGAGLDGIELALDSILRGVPGRTASIRDGRGRVRLSPELTPVAAKSGGSVRLTLRLDMQDIAEAALAEAVRSTGARGGDVVVYDPRNGHLLALASRRSDSRATTATALTEPVEPGSTLKPFVAAALLELGRVELDDVFETYNGVWSYRGRRLTDVHRARRMTFKEVVEYSSNIGMAQASERLDPQEQYEALRDFGFGVATGLPFPSEANGVLRDPRAWSGVSQASLARGYEMMATPVQLVVAYGALANGGELLQPTLIKEIRDADGALVYQHERRVVRRAISKPVADRMRSLLRSVVDSGTATQADLATYEVGGKSGTARRTVNKKYVDGDYTATFVGLFPADDPQLVVLVKLDSPDGAYYGGQIAAPVTKVVLQAALASRAPILDRSRLHQRSTPAPTELVQAAENEMRDAERGEVSGDGDLPVVLTFPAEKPTAPPVLGARAIPNVRGLSVRGAASELHRAGFRVRLVRGGTRGATTPSAGTTAKPGTLVRLQNGT